MAKKSNAPLIIGLLVLAGAGFYFWQKRKPVARPTSAPPPGTSATPYFMPSTFTPGYGALDITAPGGAERILQRDVQNPLPAYAAQLQV